jgi:hypothetical protein
MRVAVRIELTFPHAYEVEELRELPGGPSERLLYLPSGSRDGGHDGICLRITPRIGNPWIGVFAFGSPGDDGTESGVYSCPNGESLCVVSGRYTGYVVRAEDPTECDVLALSPVGGVRPVIEANLLLFWDFIAIAAWGSVGLAWQTERICWDDLQVEEITSGLIKGSGWDPVTSGRMSFEVDLNTGKIVSRTGTVPP